MIESRSFSENQNEVLLSVFSQNVYGIPTARHIRKRTEKFIERLNEDAHADYFDADFVAIQEAFTQASRQKLKKSAEHPYFSMAKKKRCLKFINGGVATMSEYPILKTEFLSFSRSANSDAMADKGILLTRVLHPLLGEIDFYNLHLQASYQNPDQYSDIREIQIREALQFVAKNSGERTVVLSGDFNMQENHGPYLGVKEAGFVDVMRELYPDSPLQTWRAENPLVDDEDADARLDYIFLRPGAGWEWDREASRGNIMTSCEARRDEADACWGEETLSDHYGVFAKIGLKRLANNSQQNLEKKSPTF